MAFSWIRSGEVLATGFLLPFTSVQDPNQAFPALQRRQGQDFNGSNRRSERHGPEGERAGCSLVDEIKTLSLSFPIL